MPDSAFTADRLRKPFLLVITVGITVIFFLMIRRFLIPLLLAGIFSAIIHPFYARLLRWFRGRRTLASAVTILLVLVLVLGPLSSVAGIFVGQAAKVTQNLKEWFDSQGRVSGLLQQLEDRVPYLERIQPYRAQIVEKAGQLAGQGGSFLLKWVTETTRGTLAFFLSLFVLLYSMFFFLMDGRKVVDRLLYLMPLPPEDLELMLDRFVSVTKATLKGTLVIGLIQGTLAGVAFAVVGIEGAFFWGTVMTLLSAVPGFGTTLVWVPAVVYLLLTGQIVAGLGLGAWCGAVVGTVDNFLRPRLVGGETQLPDLLILLGTLGGLILFGAAGLIIGPIIAALFVTVWDIYAATFHAGGSAAELPAAEEQT